MVGSSTTSAIFHTAARSSSAFAAAEASGDGTGAARRERGQRAPGGLDRIGSGGGVREQPGGGGGAPRGTRRSVEGREVLGRAVDDRSSIERLLVAGGRGWFVA